MGSIIGSYVDMFNGLFFLRNVDGIRIIIIGRSM